MRALLVVAFSWLCENACNATTPDEGHPALGKDGRLLRVLFIGNSLTAYHDLPGVVSRLASSRKSGVEIEAHGYSRPGATLEQLLQDPVALAAIRDKKKWDFVVLQEQGARPIIEPDKMSAAAGRLDEEIRKAGARTLLFLTWPPRKEPGSIEKLAATYERVGRELKCGVVPVGHAWAAALERKPALELYEADGGHPAPLGTYLAACTFFGALTGEEVEELGLAEVEGLDSKTARFLQSIAGAALKSHPLPEVPKKKS